MIQHFFHPLVCGMYALLVFGNVFKLLIPITWGFSFLHSIMLMVVDFGVHQSNHKWQLDEVPWPTMVWCICLGVAAYAGLITEGWQLGAILFCQMWWDNSWHSVFHHRPEGKPTTHTDKAWIRWGALAVAATACLFPLYK